MKFSKDIGIMQEKTQSFYYVQNWSDPKLALWGIGLHNHVDSFRKWLIYGFIFLYTEYFTLLGLYNCIFSSFPICFQSRRAIYGRRVEFLYQLEICCLLYIGSNDDALRAHLFHICIQFSLAWSNAKDGFIPFSLSNVKKENKNWLQKLLFEKCLFFLRN